MLCVRMSVGIFTIIATVKGVGKRDLIIHIKTGQINYDVYIVVESIFQKKNQS